jgi:hypothetical protein
MRPTVFAELAATELRSGTECCRGCDYIYHEVAATCPRCGEPHPFHVEPHRHAAHASRVPDHWGQPVADLSALTLRDLARACEAEHLMPDEPRNLAKGVTIE